MTIFTLDEEWKPKLNSYMTTLRWRYSHMYLIVTGRRRSEMVYNQISEESGPLAYTECIGHFDHMYGLSYATLFSKTIYIFQTFPDTILCIITPPPPVSQYPSLVASISQMILQRSDFDVRRPARESPFLSPPRDIQPCFHRINNSLGTPLRSFTVV